VPVGLSRLGELAVGQSSASTREEQDDDGDGALQTHVRIPCWLIVADHLRPPGLPSCRGRSRAESRVGGPGLLSTSTRGRKHTLLCMYRKLAQATAAAAACCVVPKLVLPPLGPSLPPPQGGEERMAGPDEGALQGG
jgi:hypothetical protein